MEINGQGTVRTRRAQCLASTATPLSIRFADVDMMRVVHHAVYLHWFEKIRFNALSRVFGISYQALEEHGLALPLTSVEVKYHRSLRFGDEPVGYCQVEVFKKAMFGVHYRIFRGDVLCTSGCSRHCFLDRTGRLLLHKPAFVLAAFADVVERYPNWVLQGEG